MTDVLLLYLFTRLDAICGLLLTIVAAIGIGGVYIAHTARSDAFILEQPVDEGFARLGRRMMLSAIAASVLLVLVPSQRDLAIIVGGKVAIDAARSPEAKEIGGLVLDAIKRQLQEKRGE